jgi:transcriptional regulator with XRE-family HTH domain
MEKKSTKHITNTEWLDSEAAMDIVDEQDLAIEIGGNIAEARVACGLTQLELAKRMNTLQPSIARAESGLKLPSHSYLLRVAKALKTHLVAPTFKNIMDEYSANTLPNQNGYFQSCNTHTSYEAIGGWLVASESGSHLNQGETVLQYSFAK